MALSALLTALTTAALADPASGVLWGVVEDRASERLADAQVTLNAPSLDAPRSQTGDGRGRLLFVGLEPGAYTLGVRRPPYDDLTLTDLTVTAGAYTKPSITLSLTGLNIEVDSPRGDVPSPTITLTSPALDEPRVERASHNGELTLYQLPPGPYTLLVEPDDYELLPRTVEVTVVKGEVRDVEVMLEERPPEELEGLGMRGYGLGGGGSAAGLGGISTRGRAGGGGGGEDYTYWGTNGFVEAALDPYSTFAVDVDTASYAIARRKIRSGYLPPPASVRVEEFVNAQTYDYVGPTGDRAPFAVDMEAAPSPFSADHHLLRIGVQGWAPSPAERDPVHLTFLVDTSGSMSSEDKLPLAQRALHHLVDNLEPDDTVALATYAGSVREVLRPRAIREASVIHDAIDDLRSGGSTAMSSGLELAYQMASEARVPGEENRVIVLSDGDANVGPATHEEILESIRQYTEEGITLSTIGFGVGNYKDTMMEQLANRGDGNYAYIDSMKEAERVFGRDLSATLRTIARDVKIQVEFNPDEVVRYRLLGYENRQIADEAFREDAVDGGEIGAGHQVTALYEVALVDKRRRSGALASVRLRAKPPGPEAPAEEWETYFPARLLHWEYAESSADLQRAVAVAAFAEVLRGSSFAADVSYWTLWGLVDHSRRPGVYDDLELLELVIRSDLIHRGEWD